MKAEKAFAVSESEHDIVSPQKMREVSVFFRYRTILSSVNTGVQRTKSPVEEAKVAASGRKRKAVSGETKTKGSRNKRVCIQAPCSVFVFTKVYIFAGEDQEHQVATKAQ